MVFLTFHVDASNARIDQEEERERNRQLEIQEAIQKRNERRDRNKVDDPSIPITSVPPKVIMVKPLNPNISTLHM